MSAIYARNTLLFKKGYRNKNPWTQALTYCEDYVVTVVVTFECIVVYCEAKNVQYIVKHNHSAPQGRSTYLQTLIMRRGIESAGCFNKTCQMNRRKLTHCEGVWVSVLLSHPFHVRKQNRQVNREKLLKLTHAPRSWDRVDQLFFVAHSTQAKLTHFAAIYIIEDIVKNKVTRLALC